MVGDRCTVLLRPDSHRIVRPQLCRDTMALPSPLHAGRASVWKRYERMVAVTRLRIDCAYDGSDFHGWARQPGLRTVQGVMEDCLNRILHVIQSPGLHLVVAGRTDTGVHASNQTCHLDIDDDVLARAIGHLDMQAIPALELRMRHALPDDIAIRHISPAPDGFDARFSALERLYVYRVSDGSTTPDPRLRHCVTAVRGTLDIDAMNEMMAMCVGLHDFGSFATPSPGGTTIREVKFARWSRTPVSPSPYDGSGSISLEDGGLISLTIIADAFARSMVRSLVNVAIQIGLGKRELSWFVEKLRHPRREGLTGPAAAAGLTLEHIEYPSDDQLAERAELIRAKRQLPEKGAQPRT